MTAASPYTSYSSWLQARYGEPVYKISLDGGFTCPNRDGSKGRGGCTYCNVDSFTPATARKIPSIAEQMRRGVARVQNDLGINKFVAYFQPNTNTYAPVERLKALFDEALSVYPDKTVGLSVGTRPDCLDDEKLDLLESYSSRVDVDLELGLESIHDKTLSVINRGHSHADFLNAVGLIGGRKLRLGVHTIFGFPTESREDMLAVADAVNRLPISFIKLHHLHVVIGSIMASDYRKKPFPLFTLEDYTDFLCEFLPRLRPDLVVQRLFATTPSAFLIAPAWTGEKSKSRAFIEKVLRERGVRQGAAYSSHTQILKKF